MRSSLAGASSALLATPRLRVAHGHVAFEILGAFWARNLSFDRAVLNFHDPQASFSLHGVPMPSTCSPALRPNALSAVMGRRLESSAVSGHVAMGNS